MERERRITTVRQLELMVSFMRDHRELALGRVKSKEGRETAKRLMLELASLLNPEGPRRSEKEWAKIWNDLKSRVKLKIISLRKSIEGTGGGPNANIVLTPLEEQVADIIGRDSGYLPGVNIEGQVQEENIENDEGDNVVNVSSNDNRQLEIEQNTIDNSLVNLQFDHEYTTVPEPADVVTVPSTPQPSTSSANNQYPETPPAQAARPHLRDRRTIRPRRPTQARPAAPASSTTLSDVHETMSRIETLKAETNRELAAAAAVQAQAAKLQAEAAMAQANASTRHAEAMYVMAQAIKAVSISIDKLTEKIGSGHLP